jgi:Flp pilus assembly CpaF family ATPase
VPRRPDVVVDQHATRGHRVGQVRQVLLHPAERRSPVSPSRTEAVTPVVNAMLPDGWRLHVVIPQITREHMAVNIRMFINLVAAVAWA